MNRPIAASNVPPSQRRLAAALGWAAAALLTASLALPYWQARLFAPQYRDGLTARMFAFKVTGDVGEINGLNHYIGMRKLDELATVERAAALPIVLGLALLCGYAFWRGGTGLRRLAVASAVAFPACFVADMAFWMRWGSSHLDPTAPIKLKPFSMPFIGVGKVAQFRSEMYPQPGFFLALAAAALAIGAYRLLRAKPPAAPAPGAGVPASGAASAPRRSVVSVIALLFAAGLAHGETLQERLDSAVPGAVIDLPAGNYQAPVVVRKPVTLRGGGKAVLSAGGRGTVVTVQAPDVRLEGLVIRGSGDSLLAEDAGARIEAPSAVIRGCRFEDVLFGVFLVHAPNALIEGNALSGKPIAIGRRGDLVRSWNSDRVVVRGNTMTGGRDFVLWFSTGSRVEGNTVRGGRYGLHFMYTDGALVSGNRFLDNSVGLYVMYSRQLTVTGNRFERQRGPSGSGLGLKESDSIIVRGNVFRDNRQAVFIDQSPLIASNANVFEGNRLSYNDIGVALMPGVRGNVFSGNAFEDNLQQVSVRGGGRLAGNDWNGNYWSDYAGYVRRGQSWGAIPYRAERVLERLVDARPSARFFLYTPAAQALELAVQAFPIFKPKAVRVDERPHVRRPPFALDSEDAAKDTAVTPLLAVMWLPAGLLSVSAAAMALARRRPSTAGARAGHARPTQALPLIWAASLSKDFGDRALFHELSFSAMPGDCLVLWGSNGAGKSTLMRCLLGIEEYSGMLRIAGLDVSKEGAKTRERIGFVAQEFAGYDWTVRQAMEFVCEVRGVDPAAVPGILAQCGLVGEEEKPVPALSGGMKQKLALAQALVADPAILLLDEPCSSLDLKSRRELVSILRGLKGTRTILMTSHHLDEVESLADRVLWLDEGRPARLLRPSIFLAELSAGSPA